MFMYDHLALFLRWLGLCKACICQRERERERRGIGNKLVAAIGFRRRMMMKVLQAGIS